LAFVTSLVQAADEGYAPRVEFGARLEPGNRIIHGAGQDPKGFDDYRKNFPTDRQPLIYMTYVGLCAPEAEVKEWGADLQRELVAMAPMKAVPQIGLNMTTGNDDGSGQDAAVAEGKYDAQIAAFADAVASLQQPVFVRIGYEFEGKWNGYHAAAYPKAWVRIARVLRERNLPVATIWCSAGAGAGWPAQERLMEYYPGDEWVDWWGVDIFGENEVAHPRLAEFLDAARAHHKPVAIGEMTPRGIGVLDGQKSWDRWFAPMLALLKQRPEIKATAYINWDWPDWSKRIGFSWFDWGDARIEQNPIVRDRWVKELSAPIFLGASTRGTIPLPAVKDGN
jgi:hypothetical protein